MNLSPWIPSLALLAMFSIACGGQPVPLKAAPGSTIGIAVGGDDGQHTDAIRRMAYSSTALDTMGVKDHQRGRLVFELQHPTDPPVELETVLVSRIAADQSSRAGYDPPLQAASHGAQVIALLRIPPDENLRGKTYTIVAKRYDRDDNEIIDGAPPYAQDLTVLDVDPIDETPLKGYSPVGSVELLLENVAETDIRLTYPHPTLTLRIPGPGGPKSAAHLVVSYPTTKIDRILNVYQWQNPSVSSSILWQDDAPVPGQVTIDLVAPDEDVSRIAVVFELSGAYDDPSPPALVSVADFVDIESTFYNQDGVEISTGGSIIPEEIF